MGIICAGMLCLVGTESWWLSGDHAPHLALPMQAKTVPHLLPPSSAFAPRADQDKTVATILARPLFSPSRRPAAAQAAFDPHQTTAVLPGLSGVIYAPGLRRAIFQMKGDTKPTVTAVSEGDRIHEWMVQSIGPDTVTLIHDGQTVSLTPTFGTVAPPPPPKPVVVSRWLKPADSGILRARWSNPQLQP